VRSALYRWEDLKSLVFRPVALDQAFRTETPAGPKAP
jgi:hypothetical protein